MIKQTTFIILSFILMAVIQPSQAMKDERQFVQIKEFGRGSATSLVWSPSNKNVAVGGSEGIWIYNERLEDVLLVKTDFVETTLLAWSPDGKWILAGSDDNQFALISIQLDITPKAETVFTDQIDTEIQSLGWSLDSTKYVIVSQYETTIREKLSNAILFKWPVSSIYDWNIDSHKLVLFDDLGATVIDVSNWSKINTYKYTLNEKLLSVSWSEHGLLAASSNGDGELRIWDIITRENVASIKDKTFNIPDIYQYTQVHFSIDGTSILIIRNTGGMLIWNFGESKLHEFNNRGKTTLSAAWSSNNRLLTLDFDNMIRIWNKDDTEKPTAEYNNYFGTITSVSWSPDSKQLASTDFDTLRIWNISSASQVRYIESVYSASVQWFEASNIVTARGGTNETVQIWDANTAQEIKSMHRVLDKGIVASVTRIAWSPNGQWIASNSSGNDVLLWDVANQKVSQVFSAHTGEGVKDIAWSPDSTQLATAGSDGKILIWDIVQGKIIHTIKNVSRVIWSPIDNRIATFAKSKINDEVIIQIWDTKQERIDLELKGTLSSVENMSWSSNGQKIAASRKDGKILIWNAITGEETEELSGHQGGVTSLAWSPDSLMIASAGYDKHIKIWRSGSD